MDVVNPITGEVIESFTDDTSSSLQKKYQKASLAQIDWSKTLYEIRHTAIRNFRDRLAADIETPAKILTQEMGKPLAHARGEINATLARIDWFLDHVEEVIKDEVVFTDGPLTEKISYEPLGVIANISAWNFPYFVGVNVFIPALLTGNAVLYKPSEYTSATGKYIENLLHESGIPDDVFQMIAGAGDVGGMLLAQPIRGVYFTGSYSTGKKIAETVAGRMIRTQLELGGKDPAYVCEDVDVKNTAESVGDGAFFNAGQSCCAVERIYVHEKIYDEFVGHLTNFAKSLKVGDPLKSDTYVSCLARKEQINVLENQISDAVNKGAKLLTGGKAIAGKGPFFEVTVLKDATHEMEIMKEESFGPIVAVQKVSSDCEAIELMNDTKFGLTGSIHTKDKERAVAILKRVNSGTVYWNCCDRVSPNLPWTGRGHSGIGSTLSKIGVRAFVQPKAWHLKQT